ncbi:Q anti-termination protein, partial [Escherichia coli EC1866]
MKDGALLRSSSLFIA